MSSAIYAIGDIHGHLDKLKAVHALIAQDQAANGHAGASVVHIGDLTDRGPDSRGVIEHLITGRAAGKPWVVIRGNHDRLFQMFLKDPNWVDHRLRADFTWLHSRMGGQTTLASYGITDTGRDAHDLWADARDLVPATHADFLADLPLYHTAPGSLFVHAGIRPGIAIDDQAEDDVLWIRDDFLLHRGPHGPLVVHGHTMVHQVEHHGNRVNIDTGAGRGDALSAIVIEGDQVSLLTPNGRHAVTPST
jgi:serine/threonine protein phosphatase 1